MRIGTINVRGMCDYRTRGRKFYHIKKHNIDIVILTELRAQHYSKKPTFTTNPSEHQWSRDAGVQGIWTDHVAILSMSPRYNITFQASHEEGRILQIEVQDTELHRSIRIYGLYLPPQDRVKECWATLTNLGPCERAIYVGDLNAWTNRHRDSYPTVNGEHKNLLHMRDCMTALSLVETLQADFLDVTQLTRWEYDL